MNISIEILDRNNEIKLGKNDYEKELRPMQARGENLVYLATQVMSIQSGDKICVKVEKEGQYLFVKLDETLNESLIYLPGTEWVYEPLFALNGLEAAPEEAFKSRRHYIQVRIAKDYEINAYRNLALNTHDQKEDSGAYPHAYANVETRNDSTFFAKNAIDGIFANNNHGSYPYQSWGINRQKDAALTIDFGRKVKLDQIGLTLRADFPHDSYWKQVTVSFDSGEKMIFDLKKESKPQYFSFLDIITKKIVLENLIKSEEDDSPFPALTQIECFGINA